MLKLLAYLRPDVLVARVEIAKMQFESVDLIECEVSLAKRLHAFHDVQQPAPRFWRFASKEERLLPIGEDEFLGANNAILNDMNFPGVWHTAEENIGADPARASRGRCQWLRSSIICRTKKCLGTM